MEVRTPRLVFDFLAGGWSTIDAMDRPGFAESEDKYAVYILGAGFSAAARLPLADELWREVLRRAEGLRGRATQFWNDLDEFVEYKRRCDGGDPTRETVNFEEFLGFLDVEFHLGLRGPDTWSDDGNESQVVAKTLIAQVLAERMPSREELPQCYVDFARKIRPCDHIVTLNYDLVLEHALDAVGVPYRLFPYRYRDAERGFLDSSREETVVLKLHGSIDWFDRSGYDRQVEHWRRFPTPGHPPDPIFHPSAPWRLDRLVDGPRPSDDPLGGIHRLRDYKAFYRNPPLFQAVPALFLPSPWKMLASTRFGDFWWGMGQAGITNFRLVIIGPSLAPHDEYFRQVVYRVVRNYQEEYWQEGFGGKRKEPLLQVDRRKSEGEILEFQSRYSFVDWTRAALCVDGFNEEVVERL